MLETIIAYIPQILPLILFLIMLGMGMTLTITDFRRVATYPRAVIIGLTNQIILLPIVAIILIMVLPLEPVFAMGLMLVAASPGGATSNLISHLAKGDTALSISMTAISSIITVFSIPLIINYSLQWIMAGEGVDIHLPLWSTVVNIFKLTALPVLIGMLINYKFPKFSTSSKSFIAWGSGIIILIALGLMVLKLDEIGNVWEFILAASLSVFLLNAITMMIGFISAKILKLKTPQAISISIESGMQNNVLGMAIATSPTLLNNPLMAAPAGVYGIIMCTTGVALIYLFRKMK